jgi:uroporphyrinogen decarboxylase
LDIILPKVKVDLGWGWEDICFRTGPLVSPDIFKECAVPGYKKISSKLRDYGVDLHLIDCDGFIEDLVPHWLEGGVNVMFPVEIGVWNADPAAFRKKYGKELRVLGGINKLEIAKGPAVIDAEIERRLPFMKEGGFIPMPDHLIIPETSLENYKYYLEQIRKIRL